MMIYIWVN